MKTNVFKKKYFVGLWHRAQLMLTFFGPLIRIRYFLGFVPLSSRVKCFGFYVCGFYYENNSDQ